MKKEFFHVETDRALKRAAEQKSKGMDLTLSQYIRKLVRQDTKKKGSNNV